MYATGESSVEIFIYENLISIKVVEILICSQVRKTERIMEKKEVEFTWKFYVILENFRIGKKMRR